MKIYLYQTSNNPNKLNKTLNNELEIDGEIQGSFDVSSIKILVHCENIIDYNYLYIPDLQRYYFINNIQFDFSKTFYISCKCDVLMTYKDEILNLKATLVSSDTDVNEYITNNYLIDNRNDVVKYAYNNVFNENGTLVLIGTVNG